MSRESFLQQMASQVEILQPAFSEHIAYNSELIPALLMAEFTQELLARCGRVSRDGSDEAFALRRAVNLLEEGLTDADPTVRDLVLTSFIEGLDDDDPNTQRLRRLFGPSLENAYRMRDER